MMHSEHHHDHDHDHTEPPSELVLRVKALESLLVEKGLVDPAAIDVLVEAYETKIGPRNGAKVVARAWSDPAFKQWLLKDATAAIASMGFTGRQGEHMKVVENTPTVHNLVVCTLCSCYPWPVLGLPPVWYKSAPYRARAVADPRGVLKEFGTELPEDVEVRVWDSTSEVRYLVLPERPEGTDGWSEEELAALVTRNSMIGVERAKVPKKMWRKMNGGHDLGGMHGFGPINPEPEAEEPVFHAEWERRVFGLILRRGSGQMEQRHVAPCPRTPTSRRLSAALLLRKLAGGAGEGAGGNGTGDGGGTGDRKVRGLDRRGHLKARPKAEQVAHGLGAGAPVTLPLDPAAAISSPATGFARSTVIPWAIRASRVMCVAASV